MCFRLTKSCQMKFSACVTILWMMWRKKQRQSYLHLGLFWKTDNSLTVGIVEKKTLTIHSIKSDLSTYVSVFEIPAFHLNKSLECLHLKTFLSDFASRQFCPGVTDLPLNSMQNFRLIQTPWTNIFCTFHTSSNLMGVAAGPQLDHKNVYSCPKTRFAKKCTETKALLLQKQKKAEEKEKQPLKPNDTLHTASKAKLKSALKQIRLSEKKARLELEKIKNKIHSESVSVEQGLTHRYGNCHERKSFNRPLHSTFLDWTTKGL